MIIYIYHQASNINVSSLSELLKLLQFLSLPFEHHQESITQQIKLNEGKNKKEKERKKKRKALHK